MRTECPSFERGYTTQAALGIFSAAWRQNMQKPVCSADRITVECSQYNQCGGGPMGAREDLEKQLKDVFGKAKYPVKSVFDLLPILPQGPMTKFTAGGKSWTAMELSQK